MKKLLILITIIILSILALSSCSDQPATGESSASGQASTTSDTDTSVDDDDEGDPTDDTEPAATPTFTPLFALQIDNNVYLSDTTERRLYGTGKIDKAAPGLFLLGDQLFDFDAVPDAITLDHTPTQARDTDDGLYTCVELTPTESQAAGAQAKYHTEFFLDSVSLGPWFLNQMRCTDIISAGGATFAVKETGALTQIGGTATAPLYILDNEFVTHNLDDINTRLDFNNRTEDFTMNFVKSARAWIKYGDQYFSESGDIWDTIGGLQELSTAMKDFNTDPRPVELPFAQAPVLVSAGTRDGLIYWIEANTGFVVTYDPDLDEIDTPFRLYTGDGMRSTGIAHRVELEPVIILHYIYFLEGGILKRLDLETGFFNVVHSGVAGIFKL